MSNELNKIHQLLRLVVQKMDINMENDDCDDNICHFHEDLKHSSNNTNLKSFRAIVYQQAALNKFTKARRSVIK